MLRLDHLVISATDLAFALPPLKETLGAAFAPGGQHSLMSTHNRLLSLGPDAYLELIAVDPAAPPPGRPRWFGLDHFTGPARLSHFVCATDDLAAELAQAPQGAGSVTELSRGDLRWQMAVTDTGRLPFDDSFPGLISWHGNLHPAQRLPDHGLRLMQLRITHPRPDALRQALAPRLPDPRVVVTEGVRGLSAVLSSPNGEIVL